MRADLGWGACGLAAEKTLIISVSGGMQLLNREGGPLQQSQKAQGSLWIQNLGTGVNPAVPISCVRVPFYPNQTLGSAILTIISWSWSSAFPALTLQEMRASLYATKKVFWLSHLTFSWD